MARTCTEPECGKPALARELCATHYRQLMRSGEAPPHERLPQQRDKKAPTKIDKANEGIEFELPPCDGSVQSMRRLQEILIWRAARADSSQRMLSAISAMMGQWEKLQDLAQLEERVLMLEAQERERAGGRAAFRGDDAQAQSKKSLEPTPHN